MKQRSLCLLLAWSLSSCISLRWERDVRYHELVEAQIETLQVGQSDLNDCLRELGAPLLVEEYAAGMALYWGWTRQSGRGISVDVPLGNNGSASISYADQNLARKGLLILLDGELRVELIRYGMLAELLGSQARRRPQAPETQSQPKE